jgi:DNA-binding MarR family transcriptional regulator
MIRDQRLTKLDWRTFACVSLHDGRSLSNEGPGCFASNRTMATEIGCDYTNLSKSLGRLEKWGYIRKEQNPRDRRRTIYRVLHGESWLDDQLSGSEND